MTETFHKVLTVLEQDLLCECKSIDSLIMPSSMLHQHDGNELLLLLNGKAEIYSEGDGKLLERGDCVCIKPRDFHRARLLDDKVYDRIVINFKDSVLQRLSTEKTDLAKCFYQVPQGELNFIRLDEDGIAEFEELAHRLENILEGDQFGADVLAEAYLMQILVMVNQRTLDSGQMEYQRILPKMVSDIFSYVEQNLTEDLSIRALEKQFQYNGVYMSRCFRQVMGTTLQQYIIAKRCSLAQQLLCQGVTPYDACFLSGFNNYSNFARTFTQQTGVSPKKYQMRNRGGR